MRTSKKSSVQASAGKRRICGGPMVANFVADWWEHQLAHVAEVDGMAHCSVPDALTRIAVADLDLTYENVERYKKCMKKPSRNGHG